MPLTMTTLDIIVNFAISFLAGYLPMLGNKDDVMRHLEKCYKKALGKWNVSQETRELMSDNMLDQLSYLQQYIKDKRKGINPKTKELLVAWLHEISRDSKCLEYINSYQTDIINYKLDDYFETLKKEVLECNSNVLKALKEQKVSLEKLSERMMEVVRVNGSYPQIQISADVDSFTRLPDKCIHRETLVENAMSMLFERNCLWIHGNVKQGKTIFSCLVAARMDGYTKLWIPFNNSNLYNLDCIISEIKGNERYLLILDAVDPGDSGLFETFIHTVESKAEDNFKIIITSRKKYSDFVFRKPIVIPEMELRLLLESEIKEIIPIDKQHLSSLILGITYGHPWLVQIALSILESSGWELTDDGIRKLFSCPKGTSVEVVVRNLVAQSVDRSDLRLLNRLLIISGSFTEEDCRTMADVKPEISNASLVLNNLCSNWIVKNDAGYSLSPLIKKSLTPDLSRNEYKDCSKAFAHHILEKKILYPNDVLNIIFLLSQAEEYEEAANFYCSALVQLRDQKLLDAPGLDTLKLMWVGVPFPVGMNMAIQIEIRICQLTIMVSQKDPHISMVASDLETLLNNYSDNAELKAVGYDLLLMSNLLIGNVSESMRLLPYSKYDNISTILDKKIDICSFMTISLNSVTTVKELVLWMKKFIEKGLSPWDLFNEGCGFAVLNIRDKSPKEQHVDILYTIIKEAEQFGNVFLPLITTAYECLIDHYSAIKDIAGVEHTYVESVKYQNDDIGKLQLNFALASAYMNFDRFDDALEAINKSTSIYDLRVLRRTSLWAIVEKAAIVGRTDPEEAVKVLMSFVANPYFGECLDEHEKMFIWGTIAFAYWKAGNRKDSVRMMIPVADYLWRNRKEDVFYVKNILLRFNALVAETWEATKKGNEDTGFVACDYSLFTKDVPHLLDDFEPLRYFGVACMVFQLADYYIKDNDLSVKLALHAVDMYKLYGNRKEDSVILMNGALPILLNNGLWNEAMYICRMSLNNCYKFENLKKGVGIATILSTTLFLSIYRASQKCNGLFVDDLLLLDYINEGRQKINSDGILERLLKEMNSTHPSFQDIPDDMMRIVLAVWHYEVLNPSDILNLLMRIYRIDFTLYPLHSVGVFCSFFAYTIIRRSMGNQPDLYNLSGRMPEIYLSRAMNYKSYECYKKLLQALFFALKNAPKLDREGENIIYS